MKTVEHRGRMLAYIEATRDDIALANRIAHEVLGRTLDELPPQTRTLLALIHGMVQEMARRQGIAAREVRFTRRDGIAAREVRFTRRDVRDATRWSDNQLKVHCARLADMEYLLVHGGGRGQHLQYELLYDGDDEGKHLCGLIDPAELDKARGYDRHKLGQEAGKLASSLGQVAPKLAPGGTEQNRASIGARDDLHGMAQKAPIHANGSGPVVAGA